MLKKNEQLKETPCGYTYMLKKMSKLRKHPTGIPICSKKRADQGKEKNSMEQLLIAHDLGTSGDKATLFTTKGRQIRSYTVPYDVHFFNGNYAEQDLSLIHI